MIGKFFRFNKFFHLSMLLVWSLLIFLFSSIPGSGKEYYDSIVFLERKGAHILEYAILAVLWMFFLESFFKKSKKELKNIAIFSSFVFAVFDEIHQVFVFGRNGRLTDIIIDLIGIILGIWLYEKIRKMNEKYILKFNKKTSR